MEKLRLSHGPSFFIAACLVCLLAATLSSREAEPSASRVSVISDWTTHHVIYPRFGPMERMLAVRHDPRAMFSWWRQGGNGTSGRFGRIPPRHRERAFRPLRRDWSINLGSAGAAPNMGPAKYSFDLAAGPSCSSDYIIFPVDTSGSATQPNLVAFNNLYSGTGTGGTGFCNRASPPTDDDGVDAAVLWSYNVSAVGGAVTTSPVISWDYAGASGSVLGTKVAFVESVAGSPAHFHVLAWKAGDGQDTTDTDGLQNTLHPATISTFVTSAPAPGSGTATDLPLGIDPSGTDSDSAPFVDYAHDVAYVGNDVGVLYRIKDVFCPSYDTDAGCTAGLAPSLDTSWGTGGVILVGGGCGALTSPVEDFATGHVFVGCSDGRLYGFTANGTPLSPAFIGLGDGTTFGGIVAPPIVDSANGFVYAVTGTNDVSPVVAQTTTSFTGTRRVALGTAPTSPGDYLFTPTFNAAYFSSGTSGNWSLLSCGYDSTGTLTTLYDIGFSSSRLINTGAVPITNQFTLDSGVDQCSPLTEFINTPGPPLSPTDRLFLSLLGSGSINSYDITSVTGAGFPTGFATSASASAAGGTSDIIVDNESSEPQASSIYFSNLHSATCGAGGTGICAVKLTQSGLN